MTEKQSPDEIRRAAKLLDDAVEAGDAATVLSCFASDCEIEFPGVTLHGKADLEKALDWLYGELGTIRFLPIKIMIDGDTFFEEFVLQAKRGAEPEVRIKATEVLVYRDYKVTQLRLYFDRLALARVLARGFLETWIVRKVERVSLKGLA